MMKSTLHLGEPVNPILLGKKQKRRNAKSKGRKIRQVVVLK